MILYRYSNSGHSGGQRVYLYDFEVLRKTPKGYWIDLGHEEKWVSADSTKRWAYPTKEEAWRSFLARKKRQASILRSQLEGIDDLLNEVKNIDTPPDDGHVFSMKVGIDWDLFS